MSDKVNFIINGKQIKDGKLVDGEALGATIGWDNKTKTATITNK